MKKLLIIGLMLGVFVTSSFSEVTRSGQIRTGGNIMGKMTFTAADSIVTSDTLSITIANIQSYMQHFTATYTLDSLIGDPSIGVTLYGRVTSNGSWTSIGTATWDDEADNPQTISSTTAANYNWLKLEFIASGATQESKILTLDVRTSNSINLPNASGTLTISRPTTGTVTVQVADDNVNAAAVYRAGGNGALTLGAAAGTTAITSSDWAIGATGVATGLGAITSDGLITGTLGATLSGAVISLNASSNFATNINTGTTNAALTLGGGSGTVAVNSSAWDITTAGAVTGLTDVTASGVITGGYKQTAVVVCSDGAETLDATQSGKTVVLTKADGASTVTIPDASAATIGVMYYIVQTKDYAFTVTSTTANNNSFVCDHVATSDAVACSTASHLIGSGMIVIGISATQWYVGALNPEGLLTPEAAD